MEDEQKYHRLIIPGVTRFLCGNTEMVVVKRDKSPGKWVAGTEQGNYTIATFSEQYINKYRTADREVLV